MRKVGNLDTIRSINRTLVLETIRSEQPISRAEVAKQVNLSRSTVSTIVDELLSKKIIYEAGFGSSTNLGGRRGMKLGFSPAFAYGVGVEVGDKETILVITDLDGNLIWKHKTDTTNNLDQLTGLIEQFIAASPISSEHIIAMGIGIPGIMDSEQGIAIQSASLGWNHVRLKEALAPQFPFPVFCENDVNCAAYGEKWLGSGKQTSDMLFITIGMGLGSAIIANGQLIRGNSYAAGEIGYFIRKEDVLEGRMHSLNEFGLFERKVAGTGLDVHMGSTANLFDQYNREDPVAIQIVNDFVVEISVVIANCVSLLNSEIVVIGGGLSSSMQTIIAPIHEIVSRYTPLSCQVRLAQLGEDAGGIGAVGLAFQYIQEF